VKEIANYEHKSDSGQSVKFLTENEVYNLTIERGTLTPEERMVINNHIVVTINMLEALPYPKDLRRVPEYAGGHHERMDGKGYPKGLKREEMSIPARMMGIADIFEALTSRDRPYKKAKTLSETLTILGKMKMDNHIDPDIFDLFIREEIYLRYAEKFLEPEQIDAVDVANILGYKPH
jgi:HD-GYP domain-containing protein (c-di-GMP phosphodiesterase class II)